MAASEGAVENEGAGENERLSSDVLRVSDEDGPRSSSALDYFNKFCLTPMVE